VKIQLSFFQGFKIRVWTAPTARAANDDLVSKYPETNTDEEGEIAFFLRFETQRYPTQRHPKKPALKNGKTICCGSQNVMPSVVLSCDGERAKLSMKIKTEGNRKYMDLMNPCRTVEMLRMSDVSQVAKTQSTTTSFVSVRGVKIPVSVVR
jgi:hypothetical protein